MRDLSSLANGEVADFFDSFDLVLCDVHGVLWNLNEPIPGTPAAVRLFQNLGKRFTIVSNSSASTVPDFCQEFKSSGFEISQENIVIPILVSISYLQKRNFNKKIFLLGTPAVRKSFQEAGFQIVQSKPLDRDCNLEGFIRASLAVDNEVGAVVAESDLTVDYVALQNAITLLRNPDVIFIKGAIDEKMCIEGDFVAIAPGCFHKILETISGRDAVPSAKPSSLMNDYIVEKLQILDPGRVLFIGDSIQADMAFATKFGYKKLLVFSGVEKRGCLENWKFPEEFKPDFYIESLGDVCDLVKM